MNSIVAAAVASAVAIGSLGYIAGTKSVSGATPDPFTVSAFQEPATVTRPAGTTGFAPQTVRPQPKTYTSTPQVTTTPAVVREPVAQPVPEKRSWKKTAIIIGASAGSGAVVGSVIDGKKGAGIGAAIGGGAASVYEVLKRR